MDERAELKASKAAQKVERLARLNRLETARLIMSQSNGRDFFYWLLTIAGTNSNPANGNALWTHYNCGSMHIGQQVRDVLIEAAPEFYMTMLKEKADARIDDSSDDLDS